MNKRLKTFSCVLATIFVLTISVSSPKIGPFGVDTVSAATGVTAPPTSGGTSNTSSTYSSSSSVTRVLKLNSKGSDVKLLQTALNTKGYKLTVDGFFGKLTLVAVKDYQSKNGLKVDGIAGPATCGKLIPKPVVTRLLKSGSVGADVKLLQTSLNTKGYKLTVDGFFGKLTLAAVKNYQSKNGLKVDGLVGPATLAKLNPTTVVTPPVVTPPVVVVPPVVDVVTAASVVDNVDVFEKSIGKDGKWIICTTKDLVSTKDLVLTGEFKNGKKDAAGVDIIQRKIGLYTQDDARVVTARFTLTAPKLTIASPKASLEHGTFKGDLYVTTADFKLIDQTVIGNVYVSGTNFTMSKASKVQGNIYFTTEKCKETFGLLDTSSVTGTKDLQVVDAVATASIVKDATAFEKAIGTAATGGKWIICSLNDITSTKELVLDGLIKKAATDLKPQRKIGLYTQAKQDGVNVVTKKFTLTAPKLTVTSPEAKIQSSNFVGDLVVASRNFLLTDSTVKGDVYVHSTEFKLAANSKIEGNVYFDNLEAQKTFILEAGSSVTGKQELSATQKTVDTVASASLVDTAAAFEKAISKDGTWIICPLKDLAINKDLVVEGELLKSGAATQRKIGLYWHDADNYTTAKYTLTAPSLTLKTKTTIQKGTFIGDLYIAAEGVTLKETKIIGNVYFATQALKDAFVLDSLSSITGVQEVKTK